MPRSDGVFISRGEPNSPDDQSRLMAIAMEGAARRKLAERAQGAATRKAAADSGTGAQTWHVVQHEGFHQFAHAVIGGDLPVWLNEGLAEYFGESLFTGDSFVTGVIPPYRLARVKRKLENRRFRSLRDMMTMSSREWSSALDIDNYDQAWSMTHFLAQGEDGKYQAPFAKFVLDLGHGKEWPDAWQANFGSDEQFEEGWRKWWLDQPEDPTAALYAQATAATLTSFLARAAGQKQAFGDLDVFVAAAHAHQLRSGEADWLPPGLLDAAVKAMEQRRDGMVAGVRRRQGPARGRRDAGPDARRRQLHPQRLVRGAGDGRRGRPAGRDRKGRAMIADGKREPARTLLRTAVTRHPKSPSADDARKLMAETR